MNSFIDNQFHRWNSKIDENSAHHDDFDKHVMYENDTLERMKPFKMAKDKAVGETTVIPMDDNDGIYHHTNHQGESAWTNPPDPNKPYIDHSLDEESVWAFRKTVYNQDVVMNMYASDPWSMETREHQPWWGLKLAAPAFYTDERMKKFMKQWNQRLGLELLKIKQADEQSNDPRVYQKHKEEIAAYVAQTEQKNVEDQWQNLYVTDHKKKAEKLLTHSDEEAEAFFKYKQALNAYKAEAPKPVVAKPKRKYEKGSLAQRIFDPLADAVRDEEGTLNYTVEDKELKMQLNEDRLRKLYNAYTNQEAIDGALDEDDEELRAALMEEADLENFPVDDWNDMLDRELSVFKNGEKYNFVKDLQDAYADGLKTPLSQKILSTVPAHAFWDIKKPIGMSEHLPMNEYNPARAPHGANFFDIRSNYAYFKEREEKLSLKPSVTDQVNY
jgi:quinol monooxygenase YgiN/DNA-binding transcriptional MerR regulator